MSEMRHRVKHLFGDCFCDEEIGSAFEVCLYNCIVEQARHAHIVRHWGNLPFKKLYANKARSMLFNLKNPATPHHRQAIQDLAAARDVDGLRTTMKRVLQMSHRELHPELWVDAVAEVAKRATRAKPADVKEDHVGMFTCARCKSTRTTYTQLQTRSADEPSTLYVLCGNCQCRWKTSG